MPRPSPFTLTTFISSGEDARAAGGAAMSLDFVNTCVGILSGAVSILSALVGLGVALKGWRPGRKAMAAVLLPAGLILAVGLWLVFRPRVFSPVRPSAGAHDPSKASPRVTRAEGPKPVVL